LLLFGPFSAFDELLQVVNIDEAATTGHHTMLIGASKRVVTTNKALWDLLHHLWALEATRRTTAIA
jgi:hypothetical protein